MSLTLYFRPSFQRSLKGLGTSQIKIVGQIVESGVESSLRIVLRIEPGKAVAILAGNHDQISHFLLKI